MNQDLVRINKLSLYSTLVLAAIGTASYFVFARDIFLAIIISEAAALIVFIITLMIYYVLSRSKSKNNIKYFVYLFMGKIIFLAAILFLISRFDFINLVVFAVSFVILFTVFLNIEIFFIYKKMLFK